MLQALKEITILIGGFFLLIFTISTAANHLDFKEDFARIEQLRVDVQNLSSDVAEEVVAMVVTRNQQIIGYQTDNKHWFWDLTVHDGWDNVQVIQIPRQLQHQ